MINFTFLTVIGNDTEMHKKMFLVHNEGSKFMMEQLDNTKNDLHAVPIIKLEGAINR